MKLSFFERVHNKHFGTRKAGSKSSKTKKGKTSRSLASVATTHQAVPSQLSSETDSKSA